MFKASEITSKEYKAIPLKAEYHQFLGRFSQAGSILMSGSPGGGKSTLALQLLADMLRHGNALYIPAEEGADSFTTQEKIKRLSIPEEICLAEWEGFEKLKDDIRDHSIRYVCLDSITYIDKNLSEFDDFRLWCKGRDVVLIVIAHSTKSGSYKGSSDLEHMVDTYIWVYPDSDDRKFAKTKKNRFGPCPKEIEIFMEAEERENPVLGAPSKVSITNEDLKRDQNQVNGYKAAGMRKNHADYLLMPSSELQELLQIDRTPLSADLTNLCKKHPEVFKSEKQVQRFIEEVNKQPELILPATNKGYVLIIHFSRNHKAMVLEMAVKQNKRRIRTAYEMKTDQVVVKIEKLTKQSDSHFPKVLGEHYQGAGMPSDIRSALSALLKDKNSASDRQNPDPLVFIGFCEQLHILQNENIPWMAGKFPMFTNTAGTKLYILPQRRVKAVRNKVEDEKATEMFENWSHYPASFKDFEIDLPDGKGKTVGTAHKIFYASDKVMQPGDKKGKVNRYKHDFNPNKRPAKVIDDVLIIENINITGRGIMN